MKFKSKLQAAAERVLDNLEARTPDQKGRDELDEFRENLNELDELLAQSKAGKIPAASAAAGETREVIDIGEITATF